MGSRYSLAFDDPIRLTCHPHEGAMTPSTGILGGQPAKLGSPVAGISRGPRSGVLPKFVEPYGAMGSLVGVFGSPRFPPAFSKGFPRSAAILSRRIVQRFRNKSSNRRANDSQLYVCVVNRTRNWERSFGMSGFKTGLCASATSQRPDEFPSNGSSISSICIDDLVRKR